MRSLSYLSKVHKGLLPTWNPELCPSIGKGARTEVFSNIFRSAGRPETGQMPKYTNSEVESTMSIFRGSRETQKGPWKRQKEVRLPRIAKSGEWSTKLNKGAKTKSEFDPELAISSFLGFEIARKLWKAAFF